MSTKEHDDVTITAEQVIDYLKQNPDFFVGRDALLSELSIPHKSGSATSLVERQVAVLRERNMDMRQRLHKFVDAAKDNDRLFEKTRRLTLQLLTTADFEAMVSMIHQSLTEDFSVELVALAFFENPGLSNADLFKLVDKLEAESYIGHLLRAGKAISGVLRPKELDFLFTPPACAKSAAIVPLGGEVPVGYLAVGSSRDDHYRSNMDTLFLSYIGEMLTLLMPSQPDTDTDST